jgi:hypothetical protein
MLLPDAIMARLAAEVPQLARVEAAAELAALVQGGRAPNRMPAAYVVPLGLRADPADVAAGLYRQRVVETVGVILVAGAAGDLRGGAALTPIHALRAAVIGALAGWDPEAGGGFGVLVLDRAALVSLNAGTIVYQVDFSRAEQLRIAR